MRLEAVALARGLGNGAPARDDRGGLMPRAHDDGGVDGAGIADEIGARQERAHRVAHEKIGNIGIFFLRAAAQGVHVVHNMLPAVARAEIERVGVLLGGKAVAEVVVRHDGKAVLGHEFGKRRVAHAVFRHTVRDL